jgi:hypothetical protein
VGGLDFRLQVGKTIERQFAIIAMVIGCIDNHSQSGDTSYIFDRENSDQLFLLQHRKMAEMMFGHQGQAFSHFLI